MKQIRAAALCLIAATPPGTQALHAVNRSRSNVSESRGRNYSLRNHDDYLASQLRSGDGYTDCHQQAPQDTSWWSSAASGHRAASLHDNGFHPVYQFPSRDVAVCPPPKNGCTYWNALLMRMKGNPDWNHPNELKRHVEMGLDSGWGVFHKPSSMTLMLVRNPVVRVLSAFLDKKEDVSGYYRDMLLRFPMTHAGFRQFIDWIEASAQSGQTLDRHWRSQREVCALSQSAKYDFYLKVECRALWSPSLFDKLQTHHLTDSGWGSDGKQPFIPVGNSTYAVEPTRIAGVQHNNKSQSHDTDASKIAKICEWYSAPTFQKVCSLYDADIHALGYAEDVQRLGQTCGFL